MKTQRLLLLAFFTAYAWFSLACQDSPYMNKKLPVEQRVNDLVSRLTLQEKIDLLSGGASGFDTKRNVRLGIPALHMTDGPVGVRWGKSTAFPSGVAMAATWDTVLIRQIGSALGREAKAHGRNVLLGPCVNIQRVPYGGRNFESFSEDPYLVSRMTVSYIKGVQNEGVVATVKHFAVNNQEYERMIINAQVDERTLREIYLPAFQASVKEAGVWAVMNAYNKLNGPYCTENDWLNNQVLKKEWNFQGLLMSDWGATHSIIESANGGLDLEMPFGDHFNNTLLKNVQEGKVSEKTIDDKIARLVRIMMQSGIFDGSPKNDTSVIYSEAHRQLNLKAAREGIVLLKNDKAMLPIDRKLIRSIAVIGPNAAVLRVGGGGSAMVNWTSAVSPLEAIKAKVGTSVNINYIEGCSIQGDVKPMDSTYLHPVESREYGLIGEYFNNRDLEGTPALVRRDARVAFDWMQGSPDPAITPDNFSVRWMGTFTPAVTGPCNMEVACDDGVRLYLDDKLLIDDWTAHAVLTNSASVRLEAGKKYRIRLEYYEHGGEAVCKLGLSTNAPNAYDEAVTAAQLSDVVFVFAGLSNNFESEGFDRKTLELPQNQVDLINAVSKANSRTIVVLNTGAAVLMSKWIDNVSSVVEMWYSGQESGHAVADLLFGDFNPSGKLPCTFPKTWEECSAFGSYPGKDGQTIYSDGLYVGYRHFEKKNIKPLFPFGHGLSYTTWKYGNIKATVQRRGKQPEVGVTLTVSNSGKVESAEVVQIYVRDIKPLVDRPVKELKAFQKVWLKPGEEEVIHVTLDEKAFSYYDTQLKSWKMNPGAYEIQAGSSSEDIRLKTTIQLK
jgi:beta-glucosidase